MLLSLIWVLVLSLIMVFGTEFDNGFLVLSLIMGFGIEFDNGLWY